MPGPASNPIGSQPSQASNTIIYADASSQVGTSATGRIGQHRLQLGQSLEALGQQLRTQARALGEQLKDLGYGLRRDLAHTAQAAFRFAKAALHIGSAPQPHRGFAADLHHSKATGFDAHLMPKGNGWNTLPASWRESQPVRQALQELGLALANEALMDAPTRAEAVKQATERLQTLLAATLADPATPYPLRLALTLADGQSFVSELKKAVLAEYTGGHGAFLRQVGLGLETDATLQAMFETAVSGALDKQLPDELRPGETQPRPALEVNGKKYVFDKELGRGNFGTVARYVSADGHRIAVKTPLLAKATSAEDRLRIGVQDPEREARAAMTALGTGGGADHVSRLIGAVRTGGTTQLVFSYAEGGSLKDFGARLDEAVADGNITRGEAVLMRATVMLDALLGGQRLQQAKGVVHFDVAARNVLISAQGKGELADFGLSRELNEDSATQKARLEKGQAPGTLPIYSSAPEVVRGDAVGPKADTWSFGMLLLEGFTDRTPFRDQFSLSQMAEHLKSASPGLTVPPFDPAALPGIDVRGLRLLIQQMIDPDPAARPTLEQVAEELTRLAPGVGGEALRAKMAALLAPRQAVSAPEPLYSVEIPVQPPIDYEN